MPTMDTYPAQTTPNNSDYHIINDGVSGETKKITRANYFTGATLVTPALGTPTALVLTNATGLTNAGLVTTAGDLGGVWKDWTPTFANLTIAGGAGVITYAKYTLIGKTCHFRLKVTMGGANVGTPPSFTLPVTAVSTIGVTEVIGGGAFTDAGNATWFGTVQIASTTAAGLSVLNAGATYTNTVPLSATVPFTWGATDYLTADGTYEIA